MKTKITLMTVSFLTLMAVSVPAMADTNVLCSVRANSKNVTGADYRGGVDAKGRAVLPADVSGSKMAMPKTLTIPLTVDLAQRMNDVLPTGSKIEGQMGVIEVQQDGRVLINGKDMTGPADTMCATVAKQKTAALKTNDAPKATPHKPKKKASKPVETVTTEPVAPKVEETAAPSTPSVETTAAPQVLETPAVPPTAAAPTSTVPQPSPVATPPGPETLAAPTSPVPSGPDSGMPTPPPSGAVVSPTEASGKPPSPLDPLSPPPSGNMQPNTLSASSGSGSVPTPVPAQIQPSQAPANPNGTLSGGAQ